MHSDCSRKPAQSERRKTQIVVLKGPGDDNVPTPPAKSKFAPRIDRELWCDVWRGRRASLMGLVRKNKGFRLLDIEAAILDELDERERRIQRLERNVLMMTRRAA